VSHNSGASGIASQRRAQQRLRGCEISFGPQQVREIDESFDPSGLQRENTVKKLLRRPCHAESTCGVAQRKQHANIVRAILQCTLEAIDRFGIPVLTRKPEAFLIGIDKRRSGHVRRFAPAVVKSPLSTNDEVRLSFALSERGDSSG
jgi:hypothetical protein